MKYYGDKKDKGSKERAGLPKEAVMRDYPKAEYGLDKGYGDSVEYLDMMAKDNARQVKK